ncbi:O-antigen ligase family protein [Methylobacterium sp. WL9]|uniref:O-antigen ligase family protein n=1 Tax=Methylobacterium sp. WL9 TaxID=2603898 RepID=UPI0011CBA10B|nr:O-antigen ligase family protein [Methylobacterium sp. WL9]TXN20105.1 O-antigen ligase family protein [Methylobacterium sp. WL9]
MIHLIWGSFPMIALQSRSTDSLPDLGRRIFGLLFVLLILSYAAIGRDVFFNRLQASNVDDPISANLVYIRCLVAACCLGAAFYLNGLGRLIGLFPVGLLPFAIFALISSAWSDDLKTSAREALQFTAFIWAVSCCVSALGKETLFGLLSLLCACFLVLSALVAILLPSIGVHTGTEVIQFSHAGRWKGIFVHKNTLGFWASVCSTWFLFLLINKRGSSVINGFVLACSTLCLIFSGSSTAIGTTFFMLIAYAVLSLRQRVSADLFGAILMVLMAASYVVFTYSLDGILGLFGRDAGLSGRVDLWFIAQDTIFDAPLLGQGFNAFGGSVFNGLASQYLGKMAAGVESSYLTLALDTGLVGTVLFLVPVCLWVYDGLRRDLPCEAGGLESRAFLLLALGTLVLAYTEATAFSVTSSVGCLCLTSFIFLRWQVQSEPNQYLAPGKPRSLGATDFGRRRTGSAAQPT